jgi:hypothetical protein
MPQLSAQKIRPGLASVRLLYLGALQRKRDEDSSPTGVPGLIYAAPFFLDLDRWPILAKNVAISAARVVEVAIQGGRRSRRM